MCEILIILCSYNGEKYIRTQIDSIINQSYLNFKLQIVDDCSKDNTIGILKSYADNYPNMIEVVERKKPSGSACMNFLMAMNEAIKYNYPYIMLSDQDDVWLKNKVLIMHETMKKLEEKYTSDMPILVHSDASVTDDQLNIVYPSMMKYSNRNGKDISFGELLMDNRVTGGASIFNRALLKKLEIIPQHAFMHDYWLALCASAFGIIEYIDRPLYLYRRHNDTVTELKHLTVYNQFKNRMGFGKKNYSQMNMVVREGFDIQKGQVEEFEGIFKDQLPVDIQNTIEKYKEFPASSFAKRLIITFRYKLYYLSFVRTIGECFLMPRKKVV